jgi:hypothetical protein
MHMQALQEWVEWIINIDMPQGIVITKGPVLLAGLFHFRIRVVT